MTAIFAVLQDLKTLLIRGGSWILRKRERQPGLAPTYDFVKLSENCMIVLVEPRSTVVIM